MLEKLKDLWNAADKRTRMLVVVIIVFGLVAVASSAKAETTVTYEDGFEVTSFSEDARPCVAASVYDTDWRVLGDQINMHLGPVFPGDGTNVATFFNDPDPSQATAFAVYEYVFETQDVCLRSSGVVADEHL